MFHVGPIIQAWNLIRGVWGAIAGAGRWLWGLVSRYRPKIPRQTITIVAGTGDQQWWSMGRIGEERAMQVSGHLHVTNITDGRVHLLHADLKRIPVAHTVLAVRHPRLDVYGSYPILPHSTTEVSIGFWIRPPIRREGQDFTATVLLTDQFGNVGKASRIGFPSLRPPAVQQPQRAAVPVESLYALVDPIEKEVASVLKDELSRYRNYGRQLGALGSVEIVYQGRRLVAGGVDWRMQAAARQSIVRDPEQATVESDNLEALVQRYRQLSVDNDRTRLVAALLGRLDRRTEYSSVGYLIVLVMFRIGRLEDALVAAGLNLRGDEAYGFSEVLRLVDTLLRFRHPEFSDELLDAAERFAETSGDPVGVNIRARVAAIRASRLGTVPVPPPENT